jgi:murein DD-endopeptidase MepM/ murein hydrolase activator NlpD
MNAKNGVADLSNWTLPIVGNYTITTYYGSSHTGIDYYSYSGYDSDIKAANNGTVYAVNTGCVAGNTSCNGGRGNYMIINHNNGNYYTLYMHLHNVYVNVGDVVSAGDVIASMGNTGYVIPTPTTYNPYGGTHLHFEVYIGIPDRGGYTISPLSLY